MIKNSLKKIIDVFGYKIEKKPKKKNFFKKNNINQIIDVGAHEGGFALKSRREGFEGKIISFEPQSKVYLTLKENSKNDLNWTVHEKCAIGEKNSTAKINIMSETQCSSILNANEKFLDMEKNHNLKNVSEEECNIYTLDYIFSNFYSLEKKIFLKIDTQGYEKLVLDGCVKTIEEIDFIQLELSNETLYENEHNYEYFLGFMKENNFILWDIYPFYKNDLGKLIQFDAIFQKNK